MNTKRKCLACECPIGNGGKTGLCASCVALKIARKRQREREAEGCWIALPDGKLRRRSRCHQDRPAHRGGLCVECDWAATSKLERERRAAYKRQKSETRALLDGRVYKPRPPKKPPRECKTCGKHTPSQATYCSVECRPVARPRACVQCSGVMPSKKERAGKTCSDECARRHWEARVGVAPPDGAPGTVRSASHRAMRARQKKTTYRRADKQAIINTLTVQQQGQCAACGCDGGKRGLVLDHDHQRDVPRLLLCTKCNVAFGMLDESPTKIRGLLEYALACCEEGLSRAA